MEDEKQTEKETSPLLSVQYADNGEFSHWHLINQQTGEVLWSSFPEETKAKVEKIVSPPLPEGKDKYEEEITKLAETVFPDSAYKSTDYPPQREIVDYRRVFKIGANKFHQSIHLPAMKEKDGEIAQLKRLVEKDEAGWQITIKENAKQSEEIEKLRVVLGECALFIEKLKGTNSPMLDAFHDKITEALKPRNMGENA